MTNEQLREFDEKVCHENHCRFPNSNGNNACNCILAEAKIVTESFLSQATKEAVEGIYSQIPLYLAGVLDIGETTAERNGYNRALKEVRNILHPHSKDEITS